MSASRAGRARWRERQLPGNPASAVYGTILVAGQLAVLSASRDSTGQIVGSLSATLVVFWLAHAYTDTLGGVLAANLDDPPSLRHALRAEWPIVESGLLPVLLLLGCAALGAKPSTAAAAALVLAVVELIGWAALAARRTSISTGRKITFTVLSGVLGLVIVGLKFLIH